MSYLVLEFDPRSHGKEGGIHNPLRSDGYYSDADWAGGLAEYWAENPVVPNSHVVVVKVERWVKK